MENVTLGGAENNTGCCNTSGGVSVYGFIGTSPPLQNLIVNLKKGLIVAAIGVCMITFNSCKDDAKECKEGEELVGKKCVAVEQENPYKQAQEACELKEANKTDKDSIYVFENGQCIGKYTGAPKKDTVLLWNSSGQTDGGTGSGIGFPTRFQLESIKKLPGMGNIVLKLYSKDQRGPPNALHNEKADSLQLWVSEGLVTIYQGDTLLIKNVPGEELVNKYKNLGIFIAQWSTELAKVFNNQSFRDGDGKAPYIATPESIGTALAKSQMTKTPIWRKFNEV
jgi:hypothetical protein